MAKKQSWLGRLGSSFKGILFGLVVLLLAVGVLFWNERRVVLRSQALVEGFGRVVSVDSSAVDPANNQELVYLTGQAEVTTDLVDPDLNLQRAAIKLQRQVEMFQWTEEARQVEIEGESEPRTEYSYSTEWSDRIVDETEFDTAQAPPNPDNFLVEAETWIADPVTVGAFQLGEDLVTSLNKYQPVDLSEQDVDVAALASQYNRPVELAGQYVYFGTNPNQPVVGDVRVWYEFVQPTEVSVVAQQAGAELTAFTTKNGQSLQLIEVGTVAAQDMFASAEKANKSNLMILRIVGFVLVLIGVSTILKPLEVLTDLIPIVDSLVNTGVWLVSLLLAIVITLLVIAVAWLAARPLLALIGIGLAIGLVGVGWQRVKASK